MKRILVGNVDAGATEESLRSAFEFFGPVVRVSLAQAEGFALVEMKGSVQADRAMAALDGTRLTVGSPAPLFLVALPHRRDFRRDVAPSRGTLAALARRLPVEGSQAPAEPDTPMEKRCTNAFSF